MFSSFLDLIAPHYCCSCGKIGDILCESCYYDIVCEPISNCLCCEAPTESGLCCQKCSPPYQRGWSVAKHDQVVRDLVALSKFESVREGCDIQARLICDTLPEFDRQAFIVPLPTIAHHIRQRGYGHAERIARKVSKLRKVKYYPGLRRKNQYVQHGASRKLRLAQAENSYTVHDELDSEMLYVLIDDVYTTGATVKYAAVALIEAGAAKENIWVAVTARQSNK